MAEPRYHLTRRDRDKVQDGLRTLAGMRRDRRIKQPRYPVSSPSKPLTLFRVHEGRDEDGLFEEWKTITRGLYPEGFIARRVTVEFRSNRTQNLVQSVTNTTIYADHLENVLFTDSYFYATNQGGEYFAVSGGQSFWSTAITVENSVFDTPTSGSVDVELFRADGGVDGGYPGITEGPIVTALTDFSIADETTCYVTFDSRRQEFIVTNQLCPAPQ
jgi:hypothetical protein